MTRVFSFRTRTNPSWLRDCHKSTPPRLNSHAAMVAGDTSELRENVERTFLTQHMSHRREEYVKRNAKNARAMKWKKDEIINSRKCD